MSRKVIHVFNRNERNGSRTGSVTRESKKLTGVQTMTRKRVTGSAEVGTKKCSVAIKYASM